MTVEFSKVFNNVSCGNAVKAYSKIELDLEYIIINLFNSLQVCSAGTVSPTTAHVTPVTTTRPSSGPAVPVRHAR